MLSSVLLYQFPLHVNLVSRVLLDASRRFRQFAKNSSQSISEGQNFKDTSAKRTLCSCLATGTYQCHTLQEPRSDRGSLWLVCRCLSCNGNKINTSISATITLLYLCYNLGATLFLAWCTSSVDMRISNVRHSYIMTTTTSDTSN
jgi:hypothetical protein